MALRWWLAYSVIAEGRCHLNSYILLAVGAPDSEYETLMESLFETFNEEGNFYFLFCPERFLVLFSFQFPQIRSFRMYSVSFPWPFLLFEHFFFRKDFLYFPLATTFSADSSGESPAFTTLFQPCLIAWVHYRGNKVRRCWFSYFESLF